MGRIHPTQHYRAAKTQPVCITNMKNLLGMLLSKKEKKKADISIQYESMYANTHIHSESTIYFLQVVLVLKT